MMSWLLVVIAGCFEVGLALGMKQSDGFTRLTPTILAMASGAVSFALLTIAMRNLSAGTAYAVWTGLGAAGTVVVGIVAMGDAANPGRLIALAVVIGGIVGLRLAE